MLVDWNLTSKDIIRALRKNGWYHVHTVGDHWQFKHPAKPGKVTVPHPKKNLRRRDIKPIMKQSGLAEKDF
ncbi:MAG: type II toxin-antitoxin system HicA family toxin [Nitrospinae bacterium]|nr:type II toxin-antitoxin system HicA family toxin [Nitrospinota bacterium]